MADLLKLNSESAAEIDKLFPKCRLSRSFGYDYNSFHCDVNENNLPPLMSNQEVDYCNSGLPLDNSIQSGYYAFSMTSEKKRSASQSDTDSPMSLRGLKQDPKLKDSRIEIAGGREVFSQSRNKVSRRKHSEDSNIKVKEVPCEKKWGSSDESTESGSMDSRLDCMCDSSSDRSPKARDTSGARTFGDHSELSMNSSSSIGQPQRTLQSSHSVEVLGNGSSGSGNTGRRKIRETIFGAEIVEIRSDGEMRPLVYETNVQGSSVVFDDIGEANRSFDCLSMGSGTGSAFHTHSSSRWEGKETTSPRRPSTVSDSDSDCSSSVSDGRKLTQMLGSLQIAEYEGSPRRYGTRTSKTSSDNAPQKPKKALSPSNSTTGYTTTSGINFPIPGFPQRVLPLLEPDSTPTKGMSPEKDNVPQENMAISPQITISTTQDNNDNADDGIMEQLELDSQAYDYMFELSETRRVLEEFFNQPETCNSFSELDYKLHRQAGNSLVGRRLATEESPRKVGSGLGEDEEDQNEASLELGTGVDERIPSPFLVPEGDRDSEDLPETEMGLQVGHSRNFTLSPETTDCDSNEVESVMSAEGSVHSSCRMYSSMPVLEDGLSSGQESDHHPSDSDDLESRTRRSQNGSSLTQALIAKQVSEIEKEIQGRIQRVRDMVPMSLMADTPTATNPPQENADLEYLDPLRQKGGTPPPPAPHPHRPDESEETTDAPAPSVEAAIQDIKAAIRSTKSLNCKTPELKADNPVWVPRQGSTRRPDSLSLRSPDEVLHIDDGQLMFDLWRGSAINHHSHLDYNDPDTDQETDRLLGQQRTDDTGFFDKDWRLPKTRTVMPSCKSAPTSTTATPSTNGHSSPTNDKKDKDLGKKKGRSKEVLIHEPAVLIEGVLFRARYLGSTQLVCEGQPTKATRMMQAEEAVSRIKAPDGETQPSTEVDLFISTEKIMVLNTDLKEIMMDHALRSISYIADIGELVVLMARRRVTSLTDPTQTQGVPKMVCHVFESEEAQFIAQSIGQAFQVAYVEFLKANGIEDHSFVREMDYQEVLNSQEIFSNELQMFAKKEMQKEVVVPKAKGEILGVVVVESGWGSMLPTVVIANLLPGGAAARSSHLNIGDQIIAINGVSLVGLPLATCQSYIRNTKNKTVVKLTVVPCPPVVEVKIKRPDTKYQLGFSVQNGVICSLLRGGIAERGGVRVGHRIIEINNQSVVAVPHEKIVNLLANSVGEICMKTMPTSMFRLLTGQETPVYI